MKLALGIFFVLSYVFWLHFLVFTSFKAARDGGHAIPAIALALVMPALLTGYLMDVTYNITFGSIMFLELPRTLTLTARCDSHLSDFGWRGKLARALCHNLLDPFQTGGHCH